MAEVHQHSANKREKYIKLIFALAGIGIGVLLLLTSFFPGGSAPPAFTRVGGETRVETAVAASWFWNTSPSWIVTTSASADAETMWAAAYCAAVLDAPLLYTSSDQHEKALVADRIAHLRATNGVFAYPARWPQAASHTCPDRDPLAPRLVDLPSRVPVANVVRCSDWKMVGAPWSTEWLPSAEKLNSTIVLAAPQSATDPPDLAVGLDLAAHLGAARLANGSDDPVSLVPIVRYLESDPALKQHLGKCKRHWTKVDVAIVVGGERIVPKDTQDVVASALTSRNWTTPLERIRDIFSPGEALLLALLVLGTSVTVAARGLWEPSLGNVRGVHPSTAPRRIWRTVTRWPKRLGGEREMIKEGTEVEVLLDSGEKVSGNWSGWRDLGGRAFIELAGANAVRQTDAPSSGNAPQQRGPLSEILKAEGSESVFVPVADLLAVAHTLGPPSKEQSSRIKLLVGSGEKLEASLIGFHDLGGRTFAELTSVSVPTAAADSPTAVAGGPSLRRILQSAEARTTLFMPSAEIVVMAAPPPSGKDPADARDDVRTERSQR